MVTLIPGRGVMYSQTAGLGTDHFEYLLGKLRPTVLPVLRGINVSNLRGREKIRMKDL